jgi:alkanesulfonate monooxygenase SsuD/methylene tetrahydromethanopterin reductase-like flavin-dependent oxidoreductase (luciferase family)
MGFDSVWVVDHIAIPPDDADGSDGRYLDILATLAWLAGITKRVKLGSGVLVLPYRAALPTAKQIATVQELSGNRLIMGMGIGWMDPEFKALGLSRHTRGSVSDETLAFMNDCFASDQVEANGQKLLFKPRPTKPPFLIGGRAPHAIKRAAKYGGLVSDCQDTERYCGSFAPLSRADQRCWQATWPYQHFRPPATR